MRDPETTKFDYGHALLIGGAYGRMGCAILAARAALRSGCGLVSVHLPARCVDPMQAAFPEAMVSIDPSDTHFTTLPPHLDRYSAIAVGPGIGTHPESASALLRLVEARPEGTPLVLDADALNILASRQPSLPPLAATVLTPHEGEYQRLFADADPQAMAEQSGAIIVHKAHRTRIYAPDGRQYENHTGNAGMATAGSGDVLTGILLGILAQRPKADLFTNVCLAVKIHGQIGDIAIRNQSESSLIASDLVENLRHISIETPTTCKENTKKD